MLTMSRNEHWRRYWELKNKPAIRHMCTEDISRMRVLINKRHPFIAASCQTIRRHQWRCRCRGSLTIVVFKIFEINSFVRTRLWSSRGLRLQLFSFLRHLVTAALLSMRPRCISVGGETYEENVTRERHKENVDHDKLRNILCARNEHARLPLSRLGIP
jgi:hypothetical protein